jgi:acyl-CoA synthetase (AMP-forming)/AMP-acid ligase II
VPSSEGVLGLVEQGAAVDPNRVAIRTVGGALSLSFRQLLALSARVGDQLRAAGVDPGASVGLVAPNVVEFVLGLLGIKAAGAVAAPLDPQLAPEEISGRLAEIGAVAAVMPATGASVVADVPVLGLDVQGSTTVVTGAARRVTDGPPLPDGCELLMFTAGTTGRAKAVPWTAANMSASVHGIVDSLELTPADATVLVMPLYHGHGLMTGLLATLATGGAATFPETGRFSASRFWGEMLDAKATWYTGVPTIHQILLARAGHEYPGGSKVPLRFVRSCSAPLAPKVAAAVRTTFGAPIVSAYGMTETAHQAASVPLREAAATEANSVGVPTSVEVRIDDGQVLVRGPGLTPGYVANDAANRESFVDGWFATGDLGRLDKGGELTITGRIKELINRGGEKVAPSTVEAALLGDSGVLDAVAFGVPDRTYGERVEAAVSLKPGSSLTQDELRRYAAQHLSEAEVPDRVLVLGRLPHTAKGTPDRKALVALATDQRPEGR